MIFYSRVATRTATTTFKNLLSACFSMKAFIVYATYRVEGNKAFIHLFGRLENGESFVTINEYKPYFYIRTKDARKAEVH